MFFGYFPAINSSLSLGPRKTWILGGTLACQTILNYLEQLEESSRIISTSKKGTIETNQIGNWEMGLRK